MNRQTTKYPYAALAAAGVLALSGCVSIAPLEPVKNPPTMFRSDNVIAVEFLNPATVGLRCGERGTQAFGMPVFHAMACGDGKLITMPDPCLTFTGGDYPSLLCDQRSRPADAPAPVAEWQAQLQPASFQPAPRPAPTPLKPRAGASIQVEFVHPSAVLQRCRTRGLDVTFSQAGDLASCGNGDILTVPNPCMLLEAGWYSRTMCHEMAHANGWSMDHPGGSFLSDARAGVDPNDVPPPRALLATLRGSGTLRPASQSPAYLAYAAANDLQAAPSAALAQPAVLDVRPASPFSGAAGLLAALKALQVSVPDFVEDAKVFAAGLQAVGAPGPRQGPAFDLMATAGLYEASLSAEKAPAEPAHLQYAALALSDPARPPVPDVQMPTEVPGRVWPAAFAALDPGLPGLGLSADDPWTKDHKAIPRLAQAALRPAAPAASGAVHTGLALRPRTAAEHQIAGGARPDAPVPPSPGPPSVKPDVPRPSRDEAGDPAAAAGV